MKKHAIIPIFIPHLGCPNDCCFCNQRSITARTSAPTSVEVRQTIETWLSTLSKERRENNTVIEIAFYGGSFTGLELDEQNYYLNVAKQYLDGGLIDGIHLSTRPDYISDSILQNLKTHGVSTIEIGVQSFNDEVLLSSNRGHDSSCVYKAAQLIKDYGFNLGIQLMIGLPQDSYESCVFSAREAASLKPSLARLYPTIVLNDTRLYDMYSSKEYQALSREEAVRRTSAMYRILTDANIYIMRVGLKSSDIIGDGGAINGGTYHPAFRQLVEGQIMREDIEAELLKILSATKATSTGNRFKVNFYSSPEWFSNMIGNSSENRIYFQEKYPELNIRFRIDESFKGSEFAIRFL